MDINESNKKVLHDDDFLFTVELFDDQSQTCSRK